jgi:hypothetical protein
MTAGKNITFDPRLTAAPVVINWNTCDKFVGPDGMHYGVPVNVDLGYYPQIQPVSVELIDDKWQPTGVKIDPWEASKYIAALNRRVKDLEGEFIRRGIDVDDMRRADQNCVCTCGRRYGDHPYGGPIGVDRDLFLHRLCDGSLVKL